MVRSISADGKFVTGTFREYRASPLPNPTPSPLPLNNSLGGIVKISPTTGAPDTTFHAIDNAVYNYYSTPQKWNASTDLAPLFDVLTSADGTKAWISTTGSGQYRGSNVDGVAKIDPTTGTIDPAFTLPYWYSALNRIFGPRGVRDIAGDGPNPTTLYLAGNMSALSSTDECGSLVRVNATTGAVGPCPGLFFARGPTGLFNGTLFDSVIYSSINNAIYASFIQSSPMVVYYKTTGQSYNENATNYYWPVGNLVRMNATTMAIESDDVFGRFPSRFKGPALTGGLSRMFSTLVGYVDLNEPFLGGGWTSSPFTSYGVGGNYARDPIYERTKPAIETTDSSGLYIGGPFLFNDLTGEFTPFFVRVDLTTGALND